MWFTAFAMKMSTNCLHMKSLTGFFSSHVNFPLSTPKLNYSYYHALEEVSNLSTFFHQNAIKGKVIKNTKCHSFSV